MYEASSLSSHAIAAATSSGVPARPAGTVGAIRASRSGAPASAWMVVSIRPGATPTTRTPSPATSRPRPSVSVSIPALAAA